MKLKELYLANSGWSPNTNVNIFNYYNADQLYSGEIHVSMYKYGEEIVRAFLNNTIYIEMEDK